MNEIQRYRKVIESIVNDSILDKLFDIKLNFKDTNLYEIFTFPNSYDYDEWIMDILHKRNEWGNWIGQSDKYLYNQIIKRESIPVRDRSFYRSTKTNSGVYLIADQLGNIIYIGKANSKNVSVVYRLIDHLMPSQEMCVYTNKMQNTPGIWNDILSIKEKLIIFYCDEMSMQSATIVETLLFQRYKLYNEGLPKYSRRG